MRCLLALLFFGVSLVKGVRLGTLVRPEHYHLDITTYFGEEDSFNFEGRVQITVSCVSPVTSITLHSKDLEIVDDQVTIRNVNISEVSDDVRILTILYKKEHDLFTIHLSRNLKQGHRYKIDIPYRGIVNDGLDGFYRSKYNDSKTNETKWLGVTQFQAVNARKAFPCFDEPEFKATFYIAIARKDGYKSMSNMPLINSYPVGNKPGWFWDIFAISKPMSTYLVAWVVFDGGFQAKESINELNNVTFKIWCRKDALDQVTFASEVGPKVLRFFEDYFGIRYPLPKLDMVAIPDFSSGGMENWGLITYRESFLLFDPKVSTKSNKRQVAHVLAHELAHQWLGNLVTMKWWSDLWLNEGFATYMSAIAVNHQFPGWNFLEEEHAYSMLNIFSFDSLRSSRPVHSVHIQSSTDIEQAFDRISYRKGSCLIRMMHLFLGEGTFRSGVTNYLNRHKYQNVQQDDLFEALTEAAHKQNTLHENWTVREIMETWTFQTGFPVISVKRNYEDGSAEITQKLFLKDTDRLENKPCWWVPLTYTTKSEPHFDMTTPKYWLDCDTAKNITIRNIVNNDWVVFNNKMAGLYKVNYDKKNWHMLADLLKRDHSQIPALNRALLFSDAADLAYIGDLPYDVFFDLFGYLEHETQYLVLATAFTKSDELETHLKSDRGHKLFVAYMKTVLTPMYHNVGGFVVRPQDEENENKIKIQTLIVSLSCKYGVQDCLNDVQKLFKRFEEHPDRPNPIPKDLTPIVYCNIIQHEGVREWDFFWQKFVSSNVEGERNMILSVLGCTRNAWLLNRYLAWSLDKSKIRNQDCSTVFSSVASRSDLGYFTAKSFFYQNIEKLTQYLKDKSSLSEYISALGYRMYDLKDLEEFKNFTKSEKNEMIFSNVSKSVNQALETITIHTQWQKRHSQTIQEVLKLL